MEWLVLKFESVTEFCHRSAFESSFFYYPMEFQFLVAMAPESCHLIGQYINPFLQSTHKGGIFPPCELSNLNENTDLWKRKSGKRFGEQ